MTFIRHPIPIRLAGLLIAGLVLASAASAAPPGDPFEDLQNQVDKLTERVDVVEENLVDVDERLSEVVEVVDTSEALEACVRVLEGELGGLPGPHVIFSGCNVHVRAKNLATDATPNGLGNLILGYNEGSCVTMEPFSVHEPEDDLQFPRGCLSDSECGDGAICDLSGRGGSHNLVVGHQHRYSSFGGILGGRQNEVSGRQASVPGGAQNKAAGRYSAVTAGSRSAAAGFGASVSGGTLNEASGEYASIAGGSLNRASGFSAHASGGVNNRVPGRQAVVVGGGDTVGLGIPQHDVVADGPNRAEGTASVVVGGMGNLTRDDSRHSVITGGLANVASGDESVITGGAENGTGISATGGVVSGGLRRNVLFEFDWRAGGKFEDD